jgi:hypothetical protein
MPADAIIPTPEQIKRFRRQADYLIAAVDEIDRSASASIPSSTLVSLPNTGDASKPLDSVRRPAGSMTQPGHPKP